MAKGMATGWFVQIGLPDCMSDSNTIKHLFALIPHRQRRVAEMSKSSPRRGERVFNVIGMTAFCIALT